MVAIVEPNEDRPPLSRELPATQPADLVELACEEAKRIRLEALRAAEADHRRLVAAAEQTCNDIVAAARREAVAIIEAARQQAERTRAQLAADCAPASLDQAPSSAQVVLETVLEEARQIRLSAIRQVQTLREAMLAQAHAEADEIVRRARESAHESTLQARANLVAAQAELQRLQDALALLGQQLEGSTAAVLPAHREARSTAEPPAGAALGRQAAQTVVPPSDEEWDAVSLVVPGGEPPAQPTYSTPADPSPAGKGDAEEAPAPRPLSGVRGLIALTQGR